MSEKAQYNEGTLDLNDGEYAPLQVDKRGALKTTSLGENPGSGDATAMDTDGNPVPVWKAHTFTYDGSGNLSTDTVTDGTDTWVKSFIWTSGALTMDSGWVKQ